jgi:hypothetical protein
MVSKQSDVSHPDSSIGKEEFNMSLSKKYNSSCDFDTQAPHLTSVSDIHHLSDRSDLLIGLSEWLRNLSQNNFASVEL